jgi:AcrR family transcriptional regulator
MKAQMSSEVIDRKLGLREIRSAETRQLLLNAAIELICEVGYGRATTTLIVERAGVTRGALQHQFGERDDLFIAVVDYVLEDFVESLRGNYLEQGSVEEKISNGIRKSWDVYTSPGATAWLEIQSASLDSTKLSERIRINLDSISKTFDQLWLDTFAELSIPAERLLAIRRMAAAALQGLARRNLLLRQEGTERTAEIDVLCEAVIHLINTSS